MCNVILSISDLVLEIEGGLSAGARAIINECASENENTRKSTTDTPSRSMAEEAVEDGTAVAGIEGRL